jgi:hypothetical protein
LPPAAGPAFVGNEAADVEGSGMFANELYKVNILYYGEEIYFIIFFTHTFLYGL